MGASATWGGGPVRVVRVRLLPDRRWSQLVDTAVAVLDTVPLHDVVIDDIATRAGVSRSLVYRYFSGLDDLLGHARQRFLTTLETKYEPILSSGGDALDKLRAVIAATLHFAAAHPGVYGNLAADVPPDSRAGAPLTRAMLHLASELRPGRDAALVATATAALIDAAIVSWLRDDPTDSETVIDLVLSLAAFGLQGRSSQVDTAEETGHVPTRRRRSVPPFTTRVDASVPRAHLDDTTRRRPHRLSGVHDGR